MQTEGKKILEVLKSGTTDGIGDMLKDFFAPAFTSTSLKESSLEYYGHFANAFFRTAVSSLLSSGANPPLLSSVDMIYPYYTHFRNHIKANDPLFLSKAFHLMLASITKTVDYVDYTLKFATYLYNELQLISSEDNTTIFANPAILWNFAGKLEKQPNFTDFSLSLRVRHMSLKLLALKAKNLPSLVTKLGSAILRFRQQVSASSSNNANAVDMESSEVWNNIIETVLITIANEDKPKKFHLNILELFVHHARFISHNRCRSDSMKNFRSMRSFLDQHIDEDDTYTESIFKICDAIIFLGDNSASTVKALTSMFDGVKDASAKLLAALTKDTLTFDYVSLICDACGIFVEGLSQYEPLKDGKLKAATLKVIVTLLEVHIKMLHSYFCLQQKSTAENKDKASRQDVYMCMSYSVFMEILYSLSETDDSNKWLLKTSSIAKNYINDIQGLSETSAKTKEKHMVYIGQWLRKFGRLCYNQGHNEAGIAIYGLLLEQMKSQDLSEESNEQNYIKTHEYLAECQKRNSDWDGSFKTIISCILIASVSALSTAVKIWLRVKKEAVKDLPDIAHKTLQNLINDNKLVVGKAEIDVATLLQFEWQSIQSSSNFFRKKHKDYAIALLTHLADVSTNPFVKSRYLYELSLILWNVPQPTSKTGKDYLTEAIDSIDESLKSAQSKDKFLLGQAYLLFYTFEQEEFHQKNFQREKFLGIHTETTQEKSKPFTLQIEIDTMEKLDRSLELFEDAAAIGDKMCSGMTATDIVALVHSIMFAASVYTASLKPLDAVRALTVAVEVCQLTENTELKLKVLCQICNVLSSLGYTALAKSLMETKLDNLQDSTATYSEKMSSLVKTLTQAELFADQGQFNKAVQLTQEVLSNCIVTSSKNKSSCAILGCAKRLLSKLKLLPLHTDDEDVSIELNNKGETPLDLAFEAMRMYTAVIHCIIQPDAQTLSNSDFGGSFDFDKYEIISEVMKSLLYLSQLYCHVGEEREAKCYIKEGLRLAEVFVLPRWSATFYLQLVRINFLSGKNLDIIKATHEAKLILLLNDKDKKELPDSPCPEAVEVVCTPEYQTSKDLASKFRWSAECSDEESTLKADTFSDHTPLSKHTISKVMSSPTSVIKLPENPIHSESCLCQTCQDVVTLELRLKCQMMSGEFSYTFGNRPFQENLQSDMEAFHLQLSGIIKANLEHTFLNKVLCRLAKKGSNAFETTDQSVYLRNCCGDLARTFLIRAQIFEQEGNFQLAFDSAKQGLVLLGNLNSYNNSEMVFLRAGLALSLANTIPHVSDDIDVNELLKSNFDVDLLSSQLSDMSLNPSVQSSPLCSDKNSGDNLEFCVDKIATLSLGEDLPKDGGDEKSGPKKSLESVKERKSVQNDILLSPFPKKTRLPEEKVSRETSLAIQSDVKELPEDETECGPKIKTKTVRKTSRSSRVSQAASKPKEILPKADTEIELGRECSHVDAGDDCKKGNFDKIIEREIEGPEKRATLEEQTSEKLGTIENLAPHSKSLDDLAEMEDTDLKPTEVKAQDSKKLKASRNVRATKTRTKRSISVSENTLDSKTDENKLPDVEEDQIESKCEKKKSTTKKSRAITENTVSVVEESQIENRFEKKKSTTKRNSRTTTENKGPVIEENEIESPCEKKKSAIKKTSRTTIKNKVPVVEDKIESPFEKKNSTATTENTLPVVDDRVESPCEKKKSAVKKTSRTTVKNKVPVEDKIESPFETKQSIAKKNRATTENTLPVVEEDEIESPCEKKKSTVKKTSKTTTRKARNCTVKMSTNNTPSPLASKPEKPKPESKIFKSRKTFKSNAAEEKENKEINIFDFDEIENEVAVTKVTKVRRQPAAKSKPTGWQKKLTEASNRIGREVKREASSPLEKRFCVSPVSLTPPFCLNDSLNLLPLSDTDSPVSSSSFLDSFSLEEIPMDMKGWEPFSKDLLNVSSPELLRAATTGDNSDDRSTYRDRRTARRGPARTLVPAMDKKCQKKDKTVEDCQDENSDPLLCNMRLRSLESAYEQMRLFPPCSLYNFTCKALAMNYLPHDPDRAAFYLTEAQAVTLRHSLITQLSRKIRKIIKDQNAGESQKKCHIRVKNAPSLEILTQAKQALSFGQKPSNIHSLIEAIHPDWTVCQVSVVASPDFSSPPILIVTQYRRNTSPTIVSLPGYSQSTGSEILKLYESIQTANRKSLSLLNKNEWWNVRYNLNSKMQNLLEQMEQHWLGCWKGILLGHLTNEDDRKKLKVSAEKIQAAIKEKCSKQPNLGLLQILIDSSEYLSAEDLNLAIIEVTGLDDVQSPDFTSIKSQILQLCKSLNSSVSDRHPLIIILDKVVQHLPWENLPILRNRPVSRVPSLYYLRVQMSYLHHKNSVITDGFDPKNTFYVLNPDDNLPCTQEIFQKSFESTEGWEGVVSKPPTADQFISALTQKDTMIYCGHGNGNKYLHGDYLQQLNCRAAALLMGCSSGQMEAKGILDETGMINNYYLAFCPVIVANLWDVTDRDIDRFLQILLNNWILSKDETKMSLSEAVVKARSACKLSYLIGCAPVVYGIPL